MMACARGISPEWCLPVSQPFSAPAFQWITIAVMLPGDPGQPGARELRHMQKTAIATGLMLMALSACQTALPKAPGQSNLAAEIVRLNQPGPPTQPEGACWESDVTPAVIETVTEQIVVAPETRGPEGQVLTPASYRTDTRTRIVRDREDVWFRAPCPTDYTVEFVASLQRALKARGYYLLALTGQMDAGTRDAVRRFQAERGLDSPRLSLAAARELGLLPTALEEL